MQESASVPDDVVALVTASPNEIVLLTTDLTVVAASDAFLRAFGATPPDMVGKDIREALAGSDSIDALVASARAAVRTRQAHRMTPGLFKTAASRQHQRLVRIDSAPVPAGNGEPRWVLQSVTAPEATGHPRAEADLQVAEARLRSILRTVPDAMIIIDEHGRIETLSSTAERLFGYTADELTGENVRVLMPNPHREHHDEYLERYLRTGERHIIGIGRVVVGLRKDGTTFPMHLTIGEMRTGEQHYFTGFIRDLTDQQLTERRLRELQAEITHMSRFMALGEMASTLAHEINQPLTAINNYLRGSHRLLGTMKEQAPAALQDALAKAGEQALRAGQIIKRLREFVARGDSERRIEPLSKLIEDASTLALVGTRENAISVSFRLDPEADQVLVDRIQIQQVLVNLIRNAVEELMETAGQRELMIETVGRDGGLVEISVADTGPGLAPEVSAHLFQPFVTTKQKGMGLGLSICRTIVEAHGGKIWADARPGGGTVFRFTLHAPDAKLEETESGR